VKTLGQAMSTPFFFEILGWYGVVAIVGAYVLISFGYLTAHSIWYQVLNGTGALGVVLVSFRKKAYQPAVLNIVWALIALVAIVSILHSSQ
jgi:hypothetical protein